MTTNGHNALEPHGAQMLAQALEDAFTDDDRGVTNNMVNGLQQIAHALRQLGNADAATPLGALEALGMRLGESGDAIAAGCGAIAAGCGAIADGCGAIASSNERIADAISDLASAVRSQTSLQNGE